MIEKLNTSNMFRTNCSIKWDNIFLYIDDLIFKNIVKIDLNYLNTADKTTWRKRDRSIPNIKYKHENQNKRKISKIIIK